MIDYTKEFDKFVSNYDMNDRNIKLKYNHSYRVMKLIEKYASKLGYSKKDIELAKVIGLLHDIGRFKQLTEYKMYDDRKSIDHALEGVKILFDENYIKYFWDKEEDYEIIKYSIFNHNKYKIEDSNNDKAIKFANLLRDVDKIDIIYLEGTLDELKLRATNDPITKEIKDEFFRNESISLKYKKCRNDHIVLYFAFAFDIKNDICLEELKKYYGNLYKTIRNEEIFKEIYQESIRYIDERIDKNVRH